MSFKNCVVYTELRSDVVFSLPLSPYILSLTATWYQTCSACGFVDKASRDREKFICTECGHFDHADKQAARNIKQKAVLEYGLTLIKVRRDSAEPKQLTLLKRPTLN